MRTAAPDAATMIPIAAILNSWPLPVEPPLEQA